MNGLTPETGAWVNSWGRIHKLYIICTICSCVGILCVKSDGGYVVVIISLVSQEMVFILFAARWMDSNVCVSKFILIILSVFFAWAASSVY